MLPLLSGSSLICLRFTFYIGKVCFLNAVVIRSVVWAFTGTLLEGEWAAAEDFLLDSGVEALYSRQREEARGLSFCPKGHGIFLMPHLLGTGKQFPCCSVLKCVFPNCQASSRVWLRGSLPVGGIFLFKYRLCWGFKNGILWLEVLSMVTINTALL